MSLWGTYAPQYGFVLLLVIWLALEVHYHRRRARRLASGWRLVENLSPFAGGMQDLASLFIGASLGAIGHEYFNINYTVFFIAALLVQVLTPKKKWVAPEEENKREAEIS